jgi:hypothetical protein
MKNTSIKFLRASLLTTVVLLSALTVSAQDGVSIRDVPTSLEQAISKLDKEWDNRYNMYINSDVLTRTLKKNKGGMPAYALGIYSFRGNELTEADSKTVNKYLNIFLKSLKNAYNEYVLANENGRFEGSFKELPKLFKEIKLTVSDLPINPEKLDLSKTRVTTFTTEEVSHNRFRTEELIGVTEKIAASEWVPQSKLLAYKYLVSSSLSLPWIWKYLDGEFTRLVREGGSTTDTILFAKLHVIRAPYFSNDSRIWKHAPRFWPNQLVTSELTGSFSSGRVVKFERTDNETKVTIRYMVGGHELWYRVDKTTVLVDNMTKEVYPIQRLENGLPLGRTFVAVGCEGKCIDCTLVFPPVKSSLEKFCLDDNNPFPSNERTKKRFMKKHDIMSDGGSSDGVVIYKVSDLAK